MTAQEWAELRREADVRRMKARGSYPLWQYLTLDRYTAATFTPPPAGSWLRPWYSDHYGTTRWHRFTGDMTWRPSFGSPSLETACGYATGSGAATYGRIMVEDATPADACRLCLRRADRVPGETLIN